jgi:hypothetical protein
VDFVVDLGKLRVGIEAKSAETIAEEFSDGLRYWSGLTRRRLASALVYGGDRRFVQDRVVVHPWFVRSLRRAARGKPAKDVQARWTPKGTSSRQPTSSASGRSW